MADELRTAFVFAGGGSLAAVQVGMLDALTAHGIRPDFVVGSSAGAINAAYYARAPNSPGIARLKQFWIDVRRRDIMPLSVQAIVSMLLFRRSSIISAQGIRKLLGTHLHYGGIEHAVLPLHIVTTDSQLGNEVVLSSGPVVEAVMASAAIPRSFAPVSIGGPF